MLLRPFDSALYSVFSIALLCAAPTQSLAQAGAPGESEKLAAAGQQAMQSGNFDEARTDFERLVKLNPGVAEIHATLAVIDFKLRQYDEAVREIHTAQKLKPGLTKLDSLLGLSEAEMDRFGDALPHLEKGFKQTEDPEVRRMCGLQLLRAYTGLSRDADAVATALALNKAFPDDPEILYHTGRIYGNYAYIVMEKLHDNAPNSIWMLQAQGEANEAQKSYEAAIVAFNHVLQLDPTRPNIHYRLGRVYLARFRDAEKNPADRDAALREFAAELEVDPSNANAGYEIAVIQAEMGNLAEAFTRYQKLVERFPDFEEALVGFGGVCLELQKADQAAPALERATHLNPNDEIAWYRLSQADRALGNRDGQKKAIDEFQKLHNAAPGAVAKSTTNPEITPQQLGATP
jgi:tetratricopeptide (TPR) repeat protein